MDDVAEMTLNTTDSNSRIQQLTVGCIQTDPDHFQCRSALLQDGSDDDLSDVTGFNADFAGLISVWRDPSDGGICLVDGHRRLDLARRTGTSQVMVQYLSCSTAGEAFGKGILINIAQWVFDSGAKVERTCACRRQALEKAFPERRLDPASKVAEELFEYFPDLKAKYGSPKRGGLRIMGQVMTKQEVIEEMTRRLVEFYRPVRIYLFGSEARDEAGPDSDLDFLVVVPDKTPEQVMRSSEGYSRLSGFGMPKDVIPWRQSDFERRAAFVRTSLPATVVREGRLLYESA